jgi:hypothetical protein
MWMWHLAPFVGTHTGTHCYHPGRENLTPFSPNPPLQTRKDWISENGQKQHKMPVQIVTRNEVMRKNRVNSCWDNGQLNQSQWCGRQRFHPCIIPAANVYIPASGCAGNDLTIPLLVMISFGLPCRALVQPSDNPVAVLSTLRITTNHLFNPSQGRALNPFR